MVKEPRGRLSRLGRLRFFFPSRKRARALMRSNAGRPRTRQTKRKAPILVAKLDRLSRDVHFISGLSARLGCKPLGVPFALGESWVLRNVHSSDYSITNSPVNALQWLRRPTIRAFGSGYLANSARA